MKQLAFVQTWTAFVCTLNYTVNETLHQCKLLVKQTQKSQLEIGKPLKVSILLISLPPCEDSADPSHLYLVMAGVATLPQVQLIRHT